MLASWLDPPPLTSHDVPRTFDPQARTLQVLLDDFARSGASCLLMFAYVVSTSAFLPCSRVPTLETTRMRPCVFMYEGGEGVAKDIQEPIIEVETVSLTHAWTHSCRTPCGHRHHTSRPDPL